MNKLHKKYPSFVSDFFEKDFNEQVASAYYYKGKHDRVLDFQRAIFNRDVVIPDAITDNQYSLLTKMKINIPSTVKVFA